MKQRKFDQIYRGLSMTATKVYDAVPIQEAWTIPMIFGEMTRKGISANLRTVEACVKQMYEQGILSRLNGNQYIRVSVEPNKTNEIEIDEEEEIMPVTKSEPAKVPTPLEMLAGMATRVNELKDMAVSLTSKLNSLAIDMEHAAIMIQEQVESESPELLELRQMRDTLKRFMG